MTPSDVFPSATAVERLARAMAIIRHGRTSVDVLTSVPRAVIELGFERVMLSSVDEEYWRPQAVQIASDSSWSARVQDTALAMPQPIELTLPERRVIERASPVIVPPPRDVHAWSKQTWSYRHPQRITAYIASPILTDGRVVGMIHADRGASCSTVSRHHASLLWSFCGVIELALEAARATERLGRIRHDLDDLVAVSRGLEPTTERAELSRHVAIAAGPESAGLTSRERQILELVARGLSNAEIAEHLALSEGTIKAHVKHILAKTQSANRTSAALKWTRGAVA